MERWPDLGRAVRRDRVALGLSVVRAARVAGVDRATWARVEAGQPVRAGTLDAIEHAIRWRAGDAWRILSGMSTPSYEAMHVHAVESGTGGGPHVVVTGDEDPPASLVQEALDVVAAMQQPTDIVAIFTTADLPEGVLEARYVTEHEGEPRYLVVGSTKCSLPDVMDAHTALIDFITVADGWQLAERE